MSDLSFADLLGRSPRIAALRARFLRTPLLLIPLALLASGCGGHKAPTVASLGPAPTSEGNRTATIPAANGQSFPIGSSISTDVGSGRTGVRYATCMQAHGVQDYPDPNGQGVITIRVSPALDPDSPLFETAQAACQALLPETVAPTAARQQQRDARALAFASCMRSHGVPGYPDPTVSASGMISQSVSKSEADPSSPTVAAAARDCANDAHGAAAP